MPDLLIELFSEEIPARMQGKAADDLSKLVTGGLVEAGLTYAGAAAFSTPRRLTLAVEGMVASSPTLREERKGPKVGAPALPAPTTPCVWRRRSSQGATPATAP